MYIDTSKSGGKYTRHLLRESFREGGKIKHRTIANLSKCSQEEIESIRFALKHKKNLAMLISIIDQSVSEPWEFLERLISNSGSISTLELVQECGTLRAGVRSDLLNFGFVDGAGHHVGFEIDLVADIARRLEVKCELVPVRSGTRIPLLLAGKVDLIAATFTQQRSRDALVDFSVGYFKTPQTLMVKRGKGISSLSDMAHRSAGAATGSAGAENFEKIQPRGILRTYPSHLDVFKSLQRDSVDAFISDWIILASLRSAVKNCRDLNILVDEIELNSGQYAIGIRENDSRWRDTINSILQDIWKDGYWEKIFHKWFGPGSMLHIRQKDISFQMVIWQ